MAKVVVLKDDLGRRFTVEVPDNTQAVVGIRDTGLLGDPGKVFKINGYDFSKSDMAVMLLGLIEAGRRITATKLLNSSNFLSLKQCRDVIDELDRGDYCPQDFEN